MKAQILRQIQEIHEGSQPLELVEIPAPQVNPGQVLVEVSACGVCHTELDEIEGRTAPPKLPVVLGHQIVGIVTQCGLGAAKFRRGDRVGIGWIYHSTGDADENLSNEFQATGRDVDGGYAEFISVPQDYAYPLPETFSAATAAPLLCAGAVGYRALKLSKLVNHARLGLTGFGASGHLVLQFARHIYPQSKIFVFARDPEQRQFARELGASWAGSTEERSPEPLSAIIDTTPAWKPVIHALKNLHPGGRLVINAIRKEETDQEELLSLSYHEHLWMEREIKTVANVTRHDIAEALPLAAAANVQVSTQCYPLAEANRALCDLKFGPVRGAKVLVME